MGPDAAGVECLCCPELRGDIYCLVFLGAVLYSHHNSLTALEATVKDPGVAWLSLPWLS